MKTCTKHLTLSYTETFTVSLDSSSSAKNWAAVERLALSPILTVCSETITDSWVVWLIVKFLLLLWTLMEGLGLDLLLII